MVSLGIQADVVYNTKQFSNEEFHAGNHQLFANVDLFVNVQVGTIYFSSNGFAHEFPFSSLHKVQENFAEYRRFEKSYALCFQNSAAVSDFLSCCIQYFNNKSVIKNAVLRAFVESKKCSVSSDEMDLCKSLLQDLYKNFKDPNKKEYNVKRKADMIELLQDYKLDDIVDAIRSSEIDQSRTLDLSSEEEYESNSEVNSVVDEEYELDGLNDDALNESDYDEDDYLSDEEISNSPSAKQSIRNAVSSSDTLNELIHFGGTGENNDALTSDVRSNSYIHDETFDNDFGDGYDSNHSFGGGEGQAGRLNIDDDLEDNGTNQTEDEYEGRGEADNDEEKERTDPVSSKSSYQLRKRPRISYVENSDEDESEHNEDSDNLEQSENVPSRSSFGSRKRSRTSHCGKESSTNADEDSQQKRKRKK
uniref:Uncharacterized protein n=1 Tax=Panagrolaimus sp. ES5 TaxID=591445 RepID=A0AC34GVQ1_9BILA